MAHSDSEEEVEAIDDLDFDNRSSEVDEANEEDAFEIEVDQEEGSDADEETGSDEDEDDGDEEEEEEEERQLAPPPQSQPPNQPHKPPPTHQPKLGAERRPSVPHLQSSSPRQRTPVERERPLSPATIRRRNIIPTIKTPRSYTVEAICAIAHPEPTHALAASRCMTHLLTGSKDGYIRDYDVFPAVNGKTFLTAPQRQHCSVVEGTMKSGLLRFWWENPATFNDLVEENSRSQVCSLLVHSDALWALAGSEHGHVNLFTVRHDPGRHITTLAGHRGPVSSLAMQHDEKGFFSAGWDGDVYQWDLNTGQHVRKFFSHRAQVAAVAVRPLGPILSPPPLGSEHPFSSALRSGANATKTHAAQDDNDDAKSDASFDPLFDDASDNDGEADGDNRHAAAPTNRVGTGAEAGLHAMSTSNSARNSLASLQRGPPVLDSTAYGAFSPDVLMTASVDGSIVLWDVRVNTPGRGVGRLEMSNKTPPWCVSACWSADGGQVYAGRRNCTVDVWDTRQFGRTVNGVPRLLRTLRNPISSGAVSCVAAFPDGRHIAVASNDNIRLWNASEGADSDVSGKTRSGVPFKIIPGHHGGIISQMVIDPAARFMVTASSNRGWSGESTKTVLIHDIKSNE